MWGITLGPVTGQLLAETITTGSQPAELAPFDPLRLHLPNTRAELPATTERLELSQLPILLRMVGEGWGVGSGLGRRR